MRNKNEAILEIYKSTVEELCERRRIEWQTFAIVNVVYLGLLKVLYDIKSLSVFQAILVTIIVSAFSWIWFIRFYGNGMRFLALRYVRNGIVEGWGHDSMFPVAKIKAKCGWKCWGGDWPFFGYRGICYTVFLYWSFVVFMLWVRAVSVYIGGFCINPHIWLAFKIGFVVLVFIFVIVVPLVIDRRQVKSLKI